MKTKDFIKKAIKIHGNRYDYSKVNYIDTNTKVCIICPIHGEFWQTPHNHLRGRKCKKCYFDSEKLNTISFIEKAKKVHGDKYDYSKVEYIDSKTKVCIICPKHGEFLQTPHNHLSCKGCPKCSVTKKLDTNIFIEKAKLIHINKYDYSKVEYKGSKEKICIICPKHGEFWQTPNNHLSNQGCPKCSIDNITNKNKFTTAFFIEKSKKVHGDKYNYSKVEYVNSKTKICIICPIHGEFLQAPNKHLLGQGCPLCSESKLEEETRILLENNKIRFEYQKRFDWLGKKSLDFYLPDYNIAIECQGKQHFIPSDFFGGEKRLLETKARDKEKAILCKTNDVKLIYYNYNENMRILKNKLYGKINRTSTRP